jgi:hypothetical protein
MFVTRAHAAGGASRKAPPLPQTTHSAISPLIHGVPEEQSLDEPVQGKRSQARKDLERILAEDSDYEGVREKLAELSI